MVQISITSASLWKNLCARRYPIKDCANDTTVGGNLGDVQIFAVHSALSTTQRYIEADAGAMRRVVEAS